MLRDARCGIWRGSPRRPKPRFVEMGPGAHAVAGLVLLLDPAWIERGRGGGATPASRDADGWRGRGGDGKRQRDPGAGSLAAEAAELERLEAAWDFVWGFRMEKRR